MVEGAILHDDDDDGFDWAVDFVLPAVEVAGDIVVGGGEGREEEEEEKESGYGDSPEIHLR